MPLNWFVSVDDHLIEPARLWQERLPERWRETGAAHRRETATPSSGSTRTARSSPPGSTRWPASGARSSRPSRSPTRTCGPGATSRPARVADMNQGFVLSSLLFPSFPRYCGQVFHEAKDKELALLCVQAWNDFILEEFAGRLPRAASSR